MSQLADYPALVDRTDAIAILGVTASTFDRLCREGRFENRVCAGPPRELYMASELRAYRAQDKRLGASPKSVTNAAGEPSKSAPLSVTPPAQIGAGERNDLGLPSAAARAAGANFGLAELMHAPALLPAASGRPGAGVLRHDRTPRPQPGRGGGSHAGETACRGIAASRACTGAGTREGGWSAAWPAPVPTAQSL